MPENPSAWLIATAKNRTFAPELGRFIEIEWTLAPTVAELFAAHTIDLLCQRIAQWFIFQRHGMI